MAITLFMDQHVPRAITIGLRLREVDVLTAHEDNVSHLDDQELLERASELGRVLFTQDDDLLISWKMMGNGFDSRRPESGRCVLPFCLK